MSRITLIKTFSFAVAFLSFTVSLNLSTHAQQSEPFSSGMGAIQLDQEVQWRKLERVLETARAVWGFCLESNCGSTPPLRLEHKCGE